MILKIFTDGGSKGNPGKASIGVVFYLKGKNIFEDCQPIGIATNNDAEYQALIFALEKLKEKDFLKKYQIKKIEFFSDSKLMISQIKGVFKVKSDKIRSYLLKIRILENEINLPIDYHHINREKNQYANFLVNKIR